MDKDRDQIVNPLSAGEAVSMLLLLAVLVALFINLSPLGLLSNVEGVRYVQMKNFALSGSTMLAWPGEQLGLTAEGLVMDGGIFELREGTLRTILPPLFAWLSSPFYVVLGDRAVHALPFLFYFLAAITLCRTLGLVMTKGIPFYLLLGLFLVSPAWLYLFGFSEHSGALFLVLSGLYFQTRFAMVSRNNVFLFAASFATGLSLLFRPEYVYILAAFTIASVAAFARRGQWREAAATASGAACALAVPVLQDVWCHGRFPGPYLAEMISQYGLSVNRSLIFLGGAVLSVLLATLWKRESTPSILRNGIPYLVGLLWITVAVITSARIPLLAFITLFPAVLLAFIGIRFILMNRTEGELREILIVAIALCMLMGAAVFRNRGMHLLGVFLPVVPFVVVYLGLDSRRFFAAPGIYAVLAIFMAFSLGNSLDEANKVFIKYTDYNAQRIDFIARHTSAGDVIIFSQVALMEHAGPLFFDRVFLVENHKKDLRGILEDLRQRNVRSCSFWTLDPWCAYALAEPYGKAGVANFPLPVTVTEGCRAQCTGSHYLARIDIQRALHQLSGGKSPSMSGRGSGG